MRAYDGTFRHVVMAPEGVIGDETSANSADSFQGRYQAHDATSVTPTRTDFRNWTETTHVLNGTPVDEPKAPAQSRQAKYYLR
jgi:hypothetical protein